MLIRQTHWSVQPPNPISIDRTGIGFDTFMFLRTQTWNNTSNTVVVLTTPVVSTYYVQHPITTPSTCVGVDDTHMRFVAWSPALSVLPSNVAGGLHEIVKWAMTDVESISTNQHGRTFVVIHTGIDVLPHIHNTPKQPGVNTVAFYVNLSNAVNTTLKLVVATTEVQCYPITRLIFNGAAHYHETSGGKLTNDIHMWVVFDEVDGIDLPDNSIQITY